MAKVYIVNGRVYKETATATRAVIVNGRVLKEVVDAAPPTGFKPYFAVNANTIMQGF